jgi:transcriptional regulator with XRE-family HTH domain
MDIGKKLYEIRTARNLSQGDIEKRTGLLRCYVSRVENGHTLPNLETLGKWSKALDIQMYQLFFEGKEPLEAGPASAGAGLDASTRKLLSIYQGLDKSDQKIVTAMVSKMGRKR